MHTRIHIFDLKHASNTKAIAKHLIEYNSNDLEENNEEEN